MMFLNSLTDWFCRLIPNKRIPQHPTARFRLEQLEDRIVPSFTTNTYTNASVQITPGFIVKETVTATVTPFQGFDNVTGQIIPIPVGATNPTSGTVLFNLNNQMATGTLDGNGQATATFQVPLLAFLTSQTLQVEYIGTTDDAGDEWVGSTFLAPLYKNFDNLVFNGLLLPSTLTFGQLTPEQVYAEAISRFQNPTMNFPFANPTTTVPFYTAQGETDTLSNGLIAFNYVDPGTIDSVTVLGFNLPGSVAFQLGAYNGFSSSSSSSSS